MAVAMNATRGPGARSRASADITSPHPEKSSSSPRIFINPYKPDGIGALSSERFAHRDGFTKGPARDSATHVGAGRSANHFSKTPRCHQSRRGSPLIPQGISGPFLAKCQADVGVPEKILTFANLKLPSQHPFSFTAVQERLPALPDTVPRRRFLGSRQQKPLVYGGSAAVQHWHPSG